VDAMMVAACRRSIGRRPKTTPIRKRLVEGYIG
jgi:hypothetical protein